MHQIKITVSLQSCVMAMLLFQLSKNIPKPEKMG